uniref:AAA+ ATPase domain-containing protein n=1 Tax=Anopheles maculatus TaxID=74869 RepID=A0A182T3Q0_9DIPT
MKIVNLYHAPAILLWLLAFNFGVQPGLAWFNVRDVIGSASEAIKKSYCALRECCNEIHIHSDITGTGKNFIAEHIIRALYKNGANSEFVHKYLGRIHFPLQSEVETYKINLVAHIKSAIARCPKSLFIFDEVEKMPSGLFDSIVTLLDHHAYTKQLDFRQSIFIFLSNVAGPEIADKLKSLVDRGIWREETKLHDFESTLEIASYNLMGGLYKSELIESHVVDHFVPFLPLEQRHVESCIRAEYAKFTDAKMSDELLR